MYVDSTRLAVVKFYHITLSLFVRANIDIKRKTGVDVVVQVYPWWIFFWFLTPYHTLIIVSKTLIDESGKGCLLLE